MLEKSQVGKPGMSFCLLTYRTEFADVGFLRVSCRLYTILRGERKSQVLGLKNMFSQIISNL